MHTHTCLHTHIQVIASGENNVEEQLRKTRKPLGNREAVRKYREKKKAHAAFLEEEVKKLRATNQQLLRRLQGHVSLEAEVVRLRSLLSDIRGKIDAEIGTFRYQKQCSFGSVNCRDNSPYFNANTEVVVREESSRPTIVDCEIDESGIISHELDIPEMSTVLHYYGMYEDELNFIPDVGFSLAYGLSPGSFQAHPRLLWLLASAMACSTQLLYQSLYPSSHRANPAAARGHLRFQATPAAASPSARLGSSPSPRRALGLRVAASAKQERRQVEVVYNPEEKFNKIADQVDQNVGITRLNLFSPCKINVFLRITGKRPDGFHDLASLFHVISLGDTIKFSLSPIKTKDRLSTNVSGVPVDESNLIIKALNLYRKKTGTDNFFWIHLDKKVPTGAGLGGGSSNAATALWAANQFSGCIASEKDLQEWSGEIGSDIPFFFSQGAAYCTGRGEIVEDIQNPLPANLPMVLIKPPEACSTAEVYKRLRLEQTSQTDPLVLLKEITENGISQDACVNDLGMQFGIANLMYASSAPDCQSYSVMFCLITFK
ncbi:hypothetical protein GUJ93_ZPchr0007g4153 [Zizania palustris]|uniref:BZIP domain-containing protein n=1 Tax=Zizania palustris TaxID=103762 RepID=A0A8J5W4C5_ZIZPA|nr:hypothetical protein GUJ93_ZPchr0007g4153 [Zizania palustris]